MDQATDTRQGEELNQESLLDYLKEQGLVKSDQLLIKQFPSGYSNLTYLVQSATTEWVLRRPPFGAKIKSAHDMSREYKVLSLLQPVYSKAPTPVLYCEDTDLIGAPFYLMERINGVVIRKKLPDGFTEKSMRHISLASIDNLVQLHSLELIDSQLITLGHHPEGYTQRQVEGWAKRYFKSETDVLPTMKDTADWLKDQIPNDPSIAFIHNDYKYDNMVLDPEDWSIKAVLDWEMATVGHPLMDLGTTLGYWAEAQDHPALKPFSLTWQPGNLSRQEVLERYAEQQNTKVDDFLFYYVFGCFKIGVIVQQIYARYRQGLTKDPRFANLNEVVKACGDNCAQAIKYQRISNFY